MIKDAWDRILKNVTGKTGLTRWILEIYIYYPKPYLNDLIVSLTSDSGISIKSSNALVL